MTRNQRASYASRTEKVVRHLSLAIPRGEIAQLADLARVAGWSDFHFNRVFRLMTADCRFDCCVTLAGQVPPGASELRSVRIEGGRCARFRQIGPYEQCWSSLDRIYAHLIFVNEELGDAPTFIHYLDDPDDKAAGILRADLHVPLCSLAAINA